VSDVHRNPETEPQSEEYEYRQRDAADYPTEIAGPGGKATLTENNERGILDAVIFRAMATHKQAELGSSHDQHAQGIYRSTDGKYAD
jgi:hypothetical protein